VLDRIKLDDKSLLHIRGITAEEAIEIQGNGLSLMGSVLWVGPTRPKELFPASRLVSRLTIFADKIQQKEFLLALREVIPEGVSVNIGKTRSIAFKNRHYLGHSVVLTGLPSEDSLKIQERGIGKFTSFGCGVFYPGNRK